MPKSLLQPADSVRVQPLDESTKPEAARFVCSWSADDVYDRFGTAGTDGQNWLKHELTERNRSGFVALHAGEVVGLLDYVYAHGAIHIGIVVAPHFRKLTVGTNLVLELFQTVAGGYPVVAECRIDNRAAIRLLRKCCFELTGVEKPEMLWRAA